MDGRCPRVDDASSGNEDFDQLVETSPPGLENEVDYLMWRAHHERTLAARARSAKAAVTHQYLAAAYAARIYEVTETPPALQELLDRLS